MITIQQTSGATNVGHYDEAVLSVGTGRARGDNSYIMRQDEGRPNWLLEICQLRRTNFEFQFEDGMKNWYFELTSILEGDENIENTSTQLC